MVDAKLLELLVCPSCKGDLLYDPEQDTLTCMNRHCPSCGMPLDENGKCTASECGQVSERAVGLRYRVEEDIPIMLIDEAEKLPLS